MARDCGLVNQDRGTPATDAARRTGVGFVFSLGLVAFLAASFLAVAQTAPQVRQPDDPSFSAEARASLAQGLATLESALAAPNWASGRIFGTAGWGPRAFSIYTAGVLTERGYPVTIVQTNDAAGARAWLLVGIQLPGTLAWVPVEPSPEPGGAQTVLGRIPMTASDAPGKSAFASAYVTYGSVVALPPNAPPTATTRPLASRPNPRQLIRFLAIDSADPDGVIVLYRWDFGDGTTAAFTDGNAIHAYAAVGNYTITLTVIDNGGRSGTIAWVLAVGSEAPAASEAPKPNCGCGK